MPGRLFQLYQNSRLINVNVNIVTAGVLAIVIAKFPVMLVGDLIGAERKLAITIAAGLIDVVVDVTIYYALHWIANHYRPRSRRGEPSNSHRSFFKDATLIQFERAILSPLYYVTAMGLMYVLQVKGVPHGWAFVIGFLTGIIVTRVVHTIWGLKTGRFKNGSGPVPRGTEPGVIGAVQPKGHEESVGTRAG